MPRSNLAVALTLTALPFSATPALAQHPPPRPSPIRRNGSTASNTDLQDEWWHLFQTYQIAALDEEKRRGYVLDYTVVRPGLRTPGIKGATDRPVAPD
jgi:hypothetical protein